MQKKVLISIVAVVIVCAGAAWLLYEQGTFSLGGKSLSAALTDVDRHLTIEQQKIYTDRIQKTQDFLASLDPGDSNYQNNQFGSYEYLAQQYYGLGQMQKAREFYEKALSLRQGHEQATVGLASVYLDAGDAEQAQVLFEMILQRSGENPDIWNRYIQLRQTQGVRGEELFKLYDQALEKTQNHVDILTKAAQFYEAEGRMSEAISFWQKAKEKNPDYAALYDIEIKRLQNLK